MNRFMMAQVGLVATVGWLATGCASITAPRTMPLTINSNIAGADVTVDGVLTGQAPTRLELEKTTRSPLVTVGAAGYASHTCRTLSKPGTGYLVADIVMCVLLFPFGCVAFIDAGGAWNELDSPVCSADLQPLNGSGWQQRAPPPAFGPGGGRGLPPPPPVGTPPPPPPPPPSL